MKCGGPKKMKTGGITQDIVGMPGYNANIRPKQMKKGGVKKYNSGGPTVPATTPTVAPMPPMKKGGSVRKAKLAAMAAPKNKITRADIITAAKRNAKKK